jgi:quinol monooxygenase YgiN
MTAKRSSADGTIGSASSELYVRVAEIDVDPAQLEAYKRAIAEEIESSVRLEPGVLALYAVSDKDDPGCVTVLEIYAEVSAYEAHLETQHFRAFKAATQGMVRALKLRDTVPIMLAAKV